MTGTAGKAVSVTGKPRRGPGRPPTPAADRVQTLRLRTRHVEMLDRVIAHRARERGEDPASVDYSYQRRALLSALIEAHVHPDAFWPTDVQPEVPPGSYTDADIAAIRAWQADQAVVLTAGAPAPIQARLRSNRRLRRPLADAPSDQT